MSQLHLSVINERSSVSLFFSSPNHSPFIRLSSIHTYHPPSMSRPRPPASRLIQALECPICKGPFVTPVSVACGHCFCSRVRFSCSPQTTIRDKHRPTRTFFLFADQCIRDALSERKECPVCREGVKEAGIRRERCVEEVMGAWSDIR
jgi:hypothetical protein